MVDAMRRSAKLTGSRLTGGKFGVSEEGSRR